MVTGCRHGYRRGVWEYHLDFVQKHNLEADRGVHSFYVGVNEYADMVSQSRDRHRFTRVLTGRGDSATARLRDLA